LAARDAYRATGITSGDESPAGWLLQKQELVFSPVGAWLQAMRTGQRASPQATNRQQAGSYKKKSSSFPLYELACKRCVPGNGHHLRRQIASRLAPTNKVEKKPAARGRFFQARNNQRF
jgi:hypothetical protein